MGQKNGRHKVTLQNGDIYDGDWKNNRATGKCKYFKKNGDVYEGEMNDCWLTGQGKMIYANGDVYDGNWKRDERHGKGKMTYTNGDVYEGEWKSDRKDGYGVMTYANGDVYKGFWLRNEKHGYGKITHTNVNMIYEGGWQHDRKCGFGSLTFQKGESMEGQWEDDELRKGKITYSNGYTYEGESRNGQEHGNGKHTTRIKKEEFKLDMQYLTDFLTVGIEKKLPNEDYCTLIFDGQIDSEKKTWKGLMTINGVFCYTGEWKNGKVEGGGLLFDGKTDTYETLYFMNGRKLKPKKAEHNTDYNSQQEQIEGEEGAIC